jgi:hypothetical protein
MAEADGRGRWQRQMERFAVREGAMLALLALLGRVDAGVSFGSKLFLLGG